MSSRSGWSSACRSGHHKSCSGYHKTGKKRKKCSCPCHAEAKKIEEQLRAAGMISPDTNVVVKRDPPAVISDELAAISGGPATESPARPSPELLDLMNRAARVAEQPIFRPVYLQIVPKGEELAADRPACFGNCAEISSTCDACPEYNACRRATA